jgi:hypothetical protein
MAESKGAGLLRATRSWNGPDSSAQLAESRGTEIESMPIRPPVGRRPRVRLGLALAFIIAGGAAAIWNLPGSKFGATPRARVAGRVWTRLPGVPVAGLKVQLVKPDQKYPPGPLLGMDWAITDASGSFLLAGGSLDTTEGTAEVYLHADASDDRWTYDPAVVTLAPGKKTEGVLIELVEGVLVEGRIVDADQGDPVTPVKLAAIGEGRLSFLGNLAPIRNTDLLGSFRFRLKPGKVELIAFGLPLAYSKAYPKGFRQTEVIPSGVRSFTLPPLRLHATEMLKSK